MTQSSISADWQECMMKKGGVLKLPTDKSHIKTMVTNRVSSRLPPAALPHYYGPLLPHSPDNWFVLTLTFFVSAPILSLSLKSPENTVNQKKNYPPL